MYTVQEAGDYHVSFTIDWADTFEDGDAINYNLLIGGISTGQGFQVDTQAARSSHAVAESFSRTVFDLTMGETIDVAVGHGSTSDKNLAGENTYLTAYKVG